jgi:hypothetical protein
MHLRKNLPVSDFNPAQNSAEVVDAIDVSPDVSGPDDDYQQDGADRADSATRTMPLSTCLLSFRSSARNSLRLANSTVVIGAHPKSVNDIRFYRSPLLEGQNPTLSCSSISSPGFDASFR